MLFKDQKAMQKDVKKNPPKRVLLQLKDASSEEKRILDTMISEASPLTFAEEKLDKELLKRIAAATNSAFIHYSGNCVALSHALLYNLKRCQAEITIINSLPLHKGLDPLCSAKIFFGQTLVNIPVADKAMSKLNNAILGKFIAEGERYFVIEVKYMQPKTFSSGHVLNAVVVGAKNNPEVIYVDAWKTRSYVYTHEELLKEYARANTVILEYHPGPVLQLEKASQASRLVAK